MDNDNILNSNKNTPSHSKKNFSSLPAFSTFVTLTRTLSTNSKRQHIVETEDIFLNTLEILHNKNSSHYICFCKLLYNI